MLGFNRGLVEWEFVFVVINDGLDFDFVGAGRGGTRGWSIKDSWFSPVDEAHRGGDGRNVV